MKKNERHRERERETVGENGGGVGVTSGNVIWSRRLEKIAKSTG